MGWGGGGLIFLFAFFNSNYNNCSYFTVQHIPVRCKPLNPLKHSIKTPAPTFQTENCLLIVEKQKTNMEIKYYVRLIRATDKILDATIENGRENLSKMLKKSELNLNVQKIV